MSKLSLVLATVAAVAFAAPAFAMDDSASGQAGAPAAQTGMNGKTSVKAKAHQSSMHQSKSRQAKSHQAKSRQAKAHQAKAHQAKISKKSVKPEATTTGSGLNSNAKAKTDMKTKSAQ